MSSNDNRTDNRTRGWGEAEVGLSAEDRKALRDLGWATERDQAKRPKYIPGEHVTRIDLDDVLTTADVSVRDDARALTVYVDLEDMV